MTEPLGQQPDARAERDRLADELRRAALRVVWRQWRMLGAAMASRSSRSREAANGTQRVAALIDPEALVLISLILQRDELRLADVLHDWTVLNSDLLSVQRIRNLKADYPAPTQDDLTAGLTWFAAVARDEAKDLRWRSLTDNSAEQLARTTQRDGASTVKMRSTRARLTDDATLLLRLRLAFGVGIKADLLAYLLAGSEQWATVRNVADATRYTAAAVRRAADDLAAARFIESRDGQPQSYRIVHGAWEGLLGLASEVPRWAAWHDRFVFVAAFLDWSQADRDRPLSEYAFGALGRELIEQHHAAFERDQAAPLNVDSPVEDLAVLVSQSVRSLAAWMEGMMDCGR